MSEKNFFNNYDKNIFHTTYETISYLCASKMKNDEDCDGS